MSIKQMYVVDVTDAPKQLQKILHEEARDRDLGQDSYMQMDSDDETVLNHIKAAYPDVADKLTSDNTVVHIWW